MTKPRIVGAATSRVAAQSAGAKVTIASKLPMSIDLQLEVKRENKIRDRGTIFTEEVWVKTGRVIKIAGTAYPIGAPPEGIEWPERPELAFGFALTKGVDKDFWDEFVKQKAEWAPIKNGLVFAYESRDDVDGQAKDSKELVSGLQPIRREDDYRMPKKISMADLRRTQEEDAAALVDAE